MNDFNACQILFIDPDTGWLDFAVRTLRKHGLNTQGLTDIDKVGRGSALSPGLQLVFVNLEFAERAKSQLQHFAEKHNRYVVVLFPVGLTPYQMSRIFKLGIYDCVGKPYDAQSLIELVESLAREICPLKQDTVLSLTHNCVSTT